MPVLGAKMWEMQLTFFMIWLISPKYFVWTIPRSLVQLLFFHLNWSSNKHPRVWKLRALLSWKVYSNEWVFCEIQILSFTDNGQGGWEAPFNIATLFLYFITICRFIVKMLLSWKDCKQSLTIIYADRSSRRYSLIEAKENRTTNSWPRAHCQTERLGSTKSSSIYRFWTIFHPITLINFPAPRGKTS